MEKTSYRDISAISNNRCWLLFREPRSLLISTSAFVEVGFQELRIDFCKEQYKERKCPAEHDWKSHSAKRKMFLKETQGNVQLATRVPHRVVNLIFRLICWTSRGLISTLPRRWWKLFDGRSDWFSPKLFSVIYNTISPRFHEWNADCIRGVECILHPLSAFGSDSDLSESPKVYEQSWCNYRENASGSVLRISIRWSAPRRCSAISWLEGIRSR